MVRVRLVTVTTVVSTPCFVADRYCQRAPGRCGKKGFSTVVTNAAGSMDGASGRVADAVDPCGAGVSDVAVVTLGLAGGALLLQAAMAAAVEPISIQRVAESSQPPSIAQSVPRER
jgi:hypothetical protein